MQVIEYAKAHPWLTGIVVVIGGIVFFAIFSGGSSDSSANAGPSRPTDAEVAANAQIAAAQIQAQAMGAQAGSAVQAAQIGANVQMNSDNKAAEVAMRALDVQKDLGLGQITAAQDVATSLQASAIGALGSLKKKDRDEALQAIVTGQVVQKRDNSGNSAGAILGGIGSILGNIGGLGSIFSDQRLKENITYLGEDSNGIGIYEYNYKGSTTRHRGRIAQDVATSHPDAVNIDHSGYLKVNALRLASL